MTGKGEIKLGMEVQDTISGLKGICTCVSNWLYGCSRIGIQPQGLDKDGRKQETEFFDEAGVKIIGPGLREEAKTPAPTTHRTGGPNREHPGRERY